MCFEGLCFLLLDHNVDKLENDVFISEILEEEFGDSGVIAAFENFTSKLKKSLWVILSLWCKLLIAQP